MFLTVYTPAFMRPRLLERCRNSVSGQTLPCQHLIVHDDIGIGMGNVYAAIADHVDDIIGRYVYVLQDDDMLATQDVAQELMAFCRCENGPAVVMVRNCKAKVTYPLLWEQRPEVCSVDLGSYVVRRDVFVNHVNDFGRRHEGDFDFIDSLWRHGYRFAWFERLFSKSQLPVTGSYQVEEQIITRSEQEMIAIGRRKGWWTDADDSGAV